MKAGEKLRALAVPGQPGQVVGVTSAYCALLAERAGQRALYISGGATAAGLGMPDLGVLNLADMAAAASQVTAVSGLPLLVDADTGFGNELAVGRTVRALERAGAAGLHLEDQVADKRCGHRPGKELCPVAEMQDRIKAACDARAHDSFVVMARTDAIAAEGAEAAVERAASYVQAGADMVFLEGAVEAGQYRLAADAVGAPVLANMTEFGVTPLLPLAELAAQRVALALYPLTAFRVMMQAAENVYRAVREDGGQQDLVPSMQTREELYERLDYHKHEQRMNKARRKGEGS